MSKNKPSEIYQQEAFFAEVQHSIYMCTNCYRRPGKFHVMKILYDKHSVKKFHRNDPYYEKVCGVHALSYVNAFPTTLLCPYCLFFLAT